MNTKRFLMLVLFALILSGCQKPDAIPALSSTIEPKDTEKKKPTLTQVQADVKNGEIFALYLVADPQIAGPDLSQWTLEALPLAEAPLVTAEDILNYDWENHAIDVTKESYQRLIEAVGGSVPVKGRLFVVVANGERIYAGAFWTLASSLSFDGVVIMDPAFSSNFSLSFALGYPTEEVFIGEDPRGDQRIREVLKEAGLLE